MIVNILAPVKKIIKYNFSLVFEAVFNLSNSAVEQFLKFYFKSSSLKSVKYF
jgi:hypothetical protein